MQWRQRSGPRLLPFCGACRVRPSPARHPSASEPVHVDDQRNRHGDAIRECEGRDNSANLAHAMAFAMAPQNLIASQTSASVIVDFSSVGCSWRGAGLPHERRTAEEKEPCCVKHITHVLRDRRYLPNRRHQHAQAHQFFNCCHDRGLGYGFLGYIRCGLYQSRNRSAEGRVVVIYFTPAPASPGIGPDLLLIGGAEKLARDRSMIPRRGLSGVARALRPRAQFTDPSRMSMIAALPAPRALRPRSSAERTSLGSSTFSP